MGEVYTYNATHLTIVDAEETIEFTQSADHGGIGTGTFTLDDEAGTLAIVGQKNFSHTESSCSFPLTFRGYIGDREYGRKEVAPGVTTARKITVSLEDLNSMAGHRLIYPSAGLTAVQGGKRPAETVAVRGAWLMASAFVGFSDLGRCSFPATKGMDAADYRYQHPGDVLADMALAAGGYNYHVNDWGSGAELTFRDDNASTADSSTLRLSNVLSDASAVTLNPKRTAVLRRSPANVISKQAYSYAKGTVVEERAATATTFNGERSGTASNSNVKTAANASEESESQLWQLSTEEDVIECSIDAVTSAQINLILPGMRLQAKFSHLVTEGYGSFTYFRVLERTVRPLVADGGLYELDLKLSPQENGPPAAAIVQRAFGRSASGGNNLSLPNPVTIGNLLVFAVGSRQDINPSAPSINPAQPNFGTGAWTKLPNVTINAGRTTAQVSGVCIYYKTATVTTSTGFIPEQMANYGLWEISGANIAAATAISLKEQADATSMDIGTLGGASGDVAVMIHLWDEQATAPPFATPPHPTLAGVTPDTGWTTRWYDSSYEGYPLLENAPVVAICDAEVTGTINPRLTKSALSNWGDATWCGAAILIPPL